jgi:hypothetical protein
MKEKEEAIEPRRLDRTTLKRKRAQQKKGKKSPKTRKTKKKKKKKKKVEETAFCERNPSASYLPWQNHTLARSPR